MKLKKDSVYVETRSVNKARTATWKDVENMPRAGLTNNGLS